MSMSPRDNAENGAAAPLPSLDGLRHEDFGPGGSRRRERLDKLVTDRGLARSRTRAQALIMEGKVLVDGRRKTKPGEMVGISSLIEIRGEDIPYVSRGGLKLEAALDSFSLPVEGKVAMDVGASTGGFTDCLLQRRVKKVYAVDVGYGQLAWKLRQDPRVTVIERTNARYLERERIPDEIDLITLDVSFISLLKVIPPLMKFLRREAYIIALVKPQFEAGRGEVGKGGIVRDEETRKKTLSDVREFLERLGLATVGVMPSPVRGQKGNEEFLLCMRRTG